MNFLKKIFSFRDNESENRNDVIQPSDDLQKLQHYIKMGHWLLIRDSYPYQMTEETRGIRPLVEKFFVNDNPSIREEIKKYISENNIIRDDNPFFYAKVLAERLVFSDYLLNLYSAIKNNNINIDDFTLLTNNVIASMLKLSPAEYIDLFSDYFLSNKLFKEINDFKYWQCLNTLLIATYATGNEELGKSILEKINEMQFDKIDKDNVSKHFQYVESRFGKLNEKWVYKYL